MGEYSYANGFNIVAILTLIFGIVPNIPGFLIQINVFEKVGMEFFAEIYYCAWFLEVGVSLVAYDVLMIVQHEKRR